MFGVVKENLFIFSQRREGHNIIGLEDTKVWGFCAKAAKVIWL